MRKGRNGENGEKNNNDVYSGRLERCTLVPIYTVGREGSINFVSYLAKSNIYVCIFSGLSIILHKCTSLSPLIEVVFMKCQINT